MSKKNRNKEQREKINSILLNNLEFTGPQIWLMTGLLVFVYFGYSFISNGFFWDDEMGLYFTQRGFWQHPNLSRWGKPGFSFIYAVPALFGYVGINFFSALVSALGVWLTYQVCRSLDLKNAFMIFPLLGFQGLYWQFSHRDLSEVLCAFFLILSLYLLYKEKYSLSALAISYNFTIRNEMAVIALLFGVYFLWKKQWIPFLLLAFGPVILNVAQYIQTGDPLSLLHETESESTRQFTGIHQDLLHFPRILIIVLSAPVLAFFVIGFFGKLRDQGSRKIWWLLYLSFLIYFVVQVILAWHPSLIGKGDIKQIFPLVPIAGIFALEGFNRILNRDEQSWNVGWWTTLSVLTLAFLSREHNYWMFLEKPEYSKFLILLIGLALLFAFYSLHLNIKIFSTLVTILVIGSTLYAYEPMKLIPEQEAIREVVHWMKENKFESRTTLTNHVAYYFFGDFDYGNRSRFPRLTLASLDTAKAGSLIIWETHYGYRPTMKLDVPFDSLRNNPYRYQFLKEFVSSDQRFAAFVFEKAMAR